MSRTKSPTFRPTVWPAEPPQPPALRCFDLQPVAGTGALEVAQVTDLRELPPDFVLQELLQDDMAPTTTEQVIEITHRWGLAGGRGPTSQQNLPAPLEREAAELEQWQASRSGDDPYAAHLIHPGVVIWHLRVLRALARHTLAYLEDAGDEAILAGWRQEIGQDDGPPNREVNFDLANQSPSRIETAWTYYSSFLNAGLSAFAVHVRVGPSPVGLPPANLYTAGCLQLSHYLAGEATVHRCANERCGQPFTRQRGRAREEYGQHRSRGVRYCSHLCAKAQSERDRRKRRAEEAGR